MDNFASHLIKLLIILPILIIGGLFSIPFLINLTSKSNNEIIKNLSSFYNNSQVQVYSETKWSTLPPTLTIRNINIVDNSDLHAFSRISIKNIKARIKLLNLLFFKISPSTIKINGFLIDADFIKNVLSKTGNGIPFDSISFSDGLISHKIAHAYSDNAHFLHVSKGNVSFFRNGFKLESTIILRGSNYQVSIEAKNKDSHLNYKNISFTIRSSSNELSIIGTRNKETTILDINGKGVSLSKFVMDILEKNKPLINPIDDDFELHSSVTVYADQSISIEKFNIKGEHIAANLAQTIGPVNHLNINIEKINLNKEMYLVHTILNTFSNTLFDFNKKRTEITAQGDKITFNNELSTKFILKATSDNKGNFTLDKAQITLPGKNNKAFFKGKIMSQNNIPTFLGSVKAYGGDSSKFLDWLYKIKTKKTSPFLLNIKLKISPYIRIIQSMKFSSNDGILEVYSRDRNYISSKHKLSEIHATNINFDNFSLELSKLLNSKSSGLPSTQNNIQNTNILIEDSSKNNTKIKELSFRSNVFGENLYINDAHFIGTNTNTFVNLHSHFNKKTNRRIIFIDVKGDKLNSSLLNISKILTVERKNGTIQRLNWSDKHIDTSPLTANDIYLTLDIKNLIREKMANLKNLSFEAKTNVDSLGSRLSFGMNGGTIDLISSMSSSKSNKTLSGELKINSTRIPDLIHLLSHNPTHLTGTTSINAKFTTSGNTPLQMVSNLNGAANSASSSLRLQHLNIDDVFTRLFKAKNESEVANLLQLSLYEGSTVFSKMIIQMRLTNGKISGTIQGLSKFTSVVSSFLSSSNKFEMSGFAKVFFFPRNASSAKSAVAKLRGHPWNLKVEFSAKELFKLMKN